MNNDDFESVASWLEAEPARYTIAISAMVVIVVAVAAVAIFRLVGWTSFALIQSIGVMLMSWLIASAYLRWRQKKLLQEAVGRIETDTPPSQTPEVFYRFVSERSMTYALAAHVVKRNGVFKTHDANQTVDKQTISGDSANAHGSNPPIHDEDAKTNDSHKVQ